MYIVDHIVKCFSNICATTLFVCVADPLNCDVSDSKSFKVDYDETVVKMLPGDDGAVEIKEISSTPRHESIQKSIM